MKAVPSDWALRSLQERNSRIWWYWWSHEKCVTCLTRNVKNTAHTGTHSCQVWLRTQEARLVLTVSC